MGIQMKTMVGLLLEFFVFKHDLLLPRLASNHVAEDTLKLVGFVPTS